ncbi:alpha-ketoacid dehydrogenase kinase [Eremomyces bilateralis CBS 781.70]|uniref:Protein-serine/threonine kinase n=1 Tax=Eremomyces bilateralis CBS 781.70 TaxID=1392243 RepID=A0A6G1FR69_9PEZI|nr:alpha-ketoacid dehydrogenase kinase [Eremomyces bilateralis CBS 781.70]KAF1808162.1 alpha-ketoacid dehydrogenase kinase [Eremomyces bilateralis CBS 781.70]
MVSAIRSAAVRLLHCPSRSRLLGNAAPREAARASIHTDAVTFDHITELASKPLHPLTLADLAKHGRPPLSKRALLASANFTLSILPARLAHRIQSLRNLPFIVVSNPHISKIHGNYVRSLTSLLPWAERDITTLEDEIRFTEVMADLVQTHADTISILARGFLEARKYISPKEVTRFLDEHLRARIGTRLIAEQHIALHMSSRPHIDQPSSGTSSRSDSPDSSFIGVIDTALCPASTIRHCESTVSDICELKYGVRPSVRINGEPGYTFAHIPVHLEYILTELLKNAFRATIEKGAEREPIEVTIAPRKEPQPLAGADSKPALHATTITHAVQGNLDEASHLIGASNELADLTGYEAPPSARHLDATTAPIRTLSPSTPGVTIRIRDRGGGIAPDNYARIWNYSFTTFSEDTIRAAMNGAANGGGSGAISAVDALNAISGAGADAGTSLAGLGYGLPLGRAYAEYFGGGIAVQSMWGWGTDVYLSLRGLGVGDQ